MRAIGWVALAAFVLGAACQSTEPGPGEGPQTGASEGPREVTHKALEGVQESLEAALPASGEIDYAAVSAAASAIHAGADAILDDRPATVQEDARPKYEGMVAELKERALALQAAGDGQQVISSRRGAGRVAASCVRCHARFAAPPAGEADAGADATPAAGEGEAPAGDAPSAPPGDSSSDG